MLAKKAVRHSLFMSIACIQYIVTLWNVQTSLMHEVKQNLSELMADWRSLQQDFIECNDAHSEYTALSTADQQLPTLSSKPPHQPQVHIYAYSSCQHVNYWTMHCT